MEISPTKQLILDAALDLFSRNGFEATSTGQIASAVGIRKSSLYNHFTSKQDILDTLLAAISEEFETRSVFSRPASEFFENCESITAHALIEQVKMQLDIILHNDRISKVRKLLTIEQFRNPQITSMQTKRAYTDVLNYNLLTIRELINKSVLIDGDAEMMAAQFAFPISAWSSLCDREPEHEDEVMTLIERHIRQFFTVYGKEAAHD